MEKIKYLIATEKDIPLIGEIYEENMAALHGVARTQEVWKELLSNKNTTYYIVYAPIPVAWFRVDLEEGGFWLGMLQVKPKYQRKGIGKYILSVIEKMAKEKDCGQIGIHTTEDNTAARALYATAGYSVTEIGPCTTADGVGRTGYTYRKNIQR